ncbi:MAG TPA: putative Ig domain-containing protein [Candidatus Baltobacteraceae bacterium]|nr:putative Ig domain-containing protein [Candidatus Baltobacteraceae bacterium]
MGGRTAFSFIRYLLVFAALGIAGCAGTPSDFNQVVLHPSATQVVAGGTVTITASVPKDTNNEGVTWVLTPGPGAPVPAGTFMSTNAEATFTAPATVTGSYFVTITATSVAFPTETNSVKITVQPPQPLKITTTSLPNGTLNVVYAGATLKATGGVVPYTWSLAAGSGPLPTGLSLSNSGTISGTPTGTTTGVFPITVQVQDSEVPAMTQTAALSITITNLLSGNYAFEFSGFNANGVVVAAGSFVSDGVSKISGGVEDYNTIAGPPNNSTLETFSGTYTIGSDGRGTLTFSTTESGTVVYAFALDSQGIHGRIVETDSSGVTGSGEIAQQNVTSCASSTLSGANGTGYVFGATGYAAAIGGNTAGPVVFVGRFTAEVPANSSTPGNIDTGETDANIPGTDTSNTFQLSVSGTFATTSQSDRCTMTFEPSTLATDTYSVYPVFATAGVVTEAFVVETDTISATNPYVTVGKMYQQVGYPFGNAEASLDGTVNLVGGLTGNIINNTMTAYLPDVALVSLTGSGSSNFTMTVLENQAGSVLNYGSLDASFDNVDTFGRLGSNLLSPIGPTFYIINTNEALCIGEINDEPFYGLLEPQSGAPFSGASALNGSFIEGTLAPTVNTQPNFSGALVLANTTTTSGTVSGTEDASGLLNQGVTGTFSSFVAATGAGTVSLTAPTTFTGAFLAVSPTKIAVISTTPANANPTITILGDQTDDFGVN